MKLTGLCRRNKSEAWQPGSELLNRPPWKNSARNHGTRPATTLGAVDFFFFFSHKTSQGGVGRGGVGGYEWGG